MVDAYNLTRCVANSSSCSRTLYDLWMNTVSSMTVPRTRPHNGLTGNKTSPAEMGGSCLSTLKYSKIILHNYTIIRCWDVSESNRGREASGGKQLGAEELPQAIPADVSLENELQEMQRECAEL